MINVLFVCLGNICRSPMAEAMFRHLVKEKGLDQVISVDSAGTGDWHVGEAPHEGTYNLLVEYGIDAEGLKARQIQRDDLAIFQYIIAMDESNVKDINDIAENKANMKIARLLDFVENPETKNIPDPYYTGNFDEVYDMIKDGCEALLAYIIKEQQLSK